MSISAANRLNLDYRSEARRFSNAALPIIDVHSHIVGPEAAKIYKQARELYGVSLTYSMTPLHEIPAMMEIFGDTLRFIAIPNFSDPNPKEAFGSAFAKSLSAFYAHGTRIVKFWAAPRGIDIGRKAGDPGLLSLGSPYRIETMEAAHELGMAFMCHVGDPDTWFATKYADAAVYGTKRSHYEPLEALLARFDNPWIAAHMGGWPEDLEFLSGMLDRHPNLHLDASATKWMVRELSKHSRDELIEFLTRFSGRIMFGSDIVTSNAHLHSEKEATEMTMKASNEQEAFDLYASRYWALRTMYESSYDGESPIADPDLAMVNPERFSALDAPRLVGKELPIELLKTFYHGAAERLLGPLHSRAV